MASSEQNCIVLLPFNSESEGLYEFIIRPAVERAGLHTVRPRDIPNADIIASSVRKAIDNATIVLADVSDQNPNILYELGVAHALDKPTIIISKDLSDVPSDLRHINILFYTDNIEERKRFKDRLSEIITREIDSIKLGSVLAPIDDTSEESRLILAKLRAADDARSAGRYTDAIKLLKDVADRGEDRKSSQFLAQALNKLGIIYQDIGDYTNAYETLQNALALYSKEGNARDEAAAYGNIANVLAAQGDLVRARDFYFRALELSERQGDVRLQGSLLTNLGSLSQSLGNIQEAERQYLQAEEIFSNTGDEAARARVVANIATLAESQGDVERASRLLEQAAKVFEAIGDRHSLSRIKHNLASIMVDIGELDRAHSLLKESLDVKQAIGDRSGSAATLVNLAVVLFQRGEIEKGLEHLLSARKIQEELGDKYGLMRTLQLLGQLLEVGKHKQEAITVLEDALDIAKSLDSPDRENIASRISSLREMKNENLGG